MMVWKKWNLLNLKKSESTKKEFRLIDFQIRRFISKERMWTVETLYNISPNQRTFATNHSALLANQDTPSNKALGGSK